MNSMPPIYGFTPTRFASFSARRCRRPNILPKGYGNYQARQARNKAALAQAERENQYGGNAIVIDFDTSTGKQTKRPAMFHRRTQQFVPYNLTPTGLLLAAEEEAPSPIILPGQGQTVTGKKLILPDAEPAPPEPVKPKAFINPHDEVTADDRLLDSQLMALARQQFRRK